jgi:hypothetical protein
MRSSVKDNDHYRRTDRRTDETAGNFLYSVFLSTLSVCPTPIMPLLLLLVGPILFFFSFLVSFYTWKFSFLLSSAFKLHFIFRFAIYVRFLCLRRKKRYNWFSPEIFFLRLIIVLCVCVCVCLCKCLCVQFFFPLFFSSMPFCKDFSYLDYLKSLLHPTGRERHTLLLDLIKTQYISVFQDKGTGVLPLTNSGAPPLQKSYKLEYSMKLCVCCVAFILMSIQWNQNL